MLSDMYLLCVCLIVRVCVCMRACVFGVFCKYMRMLGYNVTCVCIFVSAVALYKAHQYGENSSLYGLIMELLNERAHYFRVKLLMRFTTIK